MEAIAKHDFNATADDELSFRNQLIDLFFWIKFHKCCFSGLSSTNVMSKVLRLFSIFFQEH